MTSFPITCANGCLLGCAIWGQDRANLAERTSARAGFFHMTIHFFVVISGHDFYTPKKCTFWVHLGSIWGPHVPKTLLFTMNFDDFRGVVFEAPNEPNRSLRLVKSASSPADQAQIAYPSRHPFAQVIGKLVNVKPPRN